MVVVVVCRPCCGEAYLATWVAAAEAGAPAVAGEEVVSVAVAEVLEVAVGLVEVLGEVVTLVVEAQEAAGNADDAETKTDLRG